jgi:integrase
MRRHPTPDDVVVPREDGGVHTDASLGAKAVRRHAAAIGLDPSHRDFHSFRRGFVTLARTDGANPDRVERITHDARGEMIDRYTYFGFDGLCAAVLTVRVTLRSAAVVQLRKRAAGAALGHTEGHTAGGAVAFASVRSDLEVATGGIEPPT